LDIGLAIKEHCAAAFTKPVWHHYSISDQLTMVAVSGLIGGAIVEIIMCYQIL
jgi:hypothetical protein